MLLAEIKRCCAIIRQQGRGGTSHRDTSAIKDRTAMGNRQRLPGALLDEQHRCPRRRETGDAGETFLHQRGGERGCGLIEDDDARAGHQRAGKGELLTLATRERTGPRAAPRRQRREQREHLLNARLLARNTLDDSEIFGDRE